MRIDFHRHLEGSHSARALVQVARRFSLQDPLFWDAGHQRYLSEDELGPKLVMQGEPGDAGAFYAAIEVARRAYVSVEAVGALAYESFLDALSEVDGLEMRASLFSMTRTLLGKEWRQTTPLIFAERARAVLLTVLEARDRASAETGKPALLRVGFSRTFESAPHYRAMADMLVEHAPRLCGLDVLGILPVGDREPLVPELVEILEGLRRSLPDLTIHAGELEDHHSVERALGLSPRGIGHGVRSLGSTSTLQHLADSGVTLEVCPSSNLLLIPEEISRLRGLHGGAHPLCALQSHAVHAVLGSDDPVPMCTSFPNEEAIMDAEGVDRERLAADVARRWAELGGPALSGGA